MLTDPRAMRTVLANHEIFIGFNNFQYDNVVLFHNGFNDLLTQNKYGDTKFKKGVNVDLMQLFKNRASSMKIDKGMLGDLLMRFSLDFITQMIGLVKESDGKIKGFDYSILKKETWTDEEWKYIVEYTSKDIELTKKLYEWVEDYFSGFKHFLNEKDIKNKVYLTAQTSVFAYKAICKEMGWKEEYDSNTKPVTFGGGYVAFPAGEEFGGDILCFDFNSLYPSIMHQCNLYSHVAPGETGWTGNGKFKVMGVYNDKIQGEIEKLIIKFYELRLLFKDNGDPREYSIKIIINTMYGLAGNPVFKHLFKTTTAADCTRLGRQWTKLARLRFREAGFKIIYTDTDSVYVINNQENRDKIMAVKDAIIKEIKDNIPFPSKHFDMGIDDEITNMWFFKGKGVEDKDSDKEMDEDDFIHKHLGFMKKNYIYRTKAGKIKVKNLGVNKKSISALTRKIFWDILVPKISEKRKVKFSKTFFRNLIQKLLEQDLSLAAIRYKVNAPDTYKLNSQLQCQISLKYGEGIHFVIPNMKGVGAGKNSKKMYCTMEDFKLHNLRLEDIDLSNVWRELNYFIREEKMMGLADF